MYYCEELFVIKHKSRHSCVSDIFYNLGPATITKNCKFDYYYNTTVPPVILDGGRDVLVANFPGPRSLKCSSVNGCLAKPAPEHTYEVVNREFLCDCQLDICHASARPPAFQSTAPHFPSSLDGIRNHKAQNGSRSSECGNQTPPSKSDTALFLRGKASANQRLSRH